MCFLFYREEMEEIKQEILSVFAKYSSKCVELEEKVGKQSVQATRSGATAHHATGCKE